MKAHLAMMATLALLGCASPDYGPHDLALTGAASPGAREALQQQLDTHNCRTNSNHEATKLAEAADGPAITVAFRAMERYAQLDDPTRDWTRDQATSPSTRCPPTGRKHRFFA